MLDASLKNAIKQYQKDPTPSNGLALASQILLGNAAALNVAALVLLLACIWCASGLIAIDMAYLWPSFLTPLLTHEAFRQPVTASTLAFLISAAPIGHLIGRFTINKYRLWQPLRGGTRFVLMQTAGWSLYGAGFLLVGLDLTHKLFYSRVLCITCTPGLLTGIALLALVGNALLLSSLYRFDSRPAALNEARTQKTLALCAAACLTAVVALTSVLARHPDLKPYLTESPSEFSTSGLDLPFCEPPYEYSAYISQPVSMLAHLPFVPLTLLATIKPHIASPQARLLLLQSALQAWTAFAGHALSNPRVVYTQEVSILLVGLAFHAFFESLHEKSTKGGKAPTTGGLLGGAIGGPANEVLAVVGITLAWYLSFGLPSAISVGLVLLTLVLYLGGEDAFGKLSKPAIKTLAISTPLIFALLGAEVASCKSLLQLARAPWHVVFDILFWQVYWTLLDVVALAKPGSSLVVDK